jgi:single-stranded-DNA-specific exonuclease
LKESNYHWTRTEPAEALSDSFSAAASAAQLPPFIAKLLWTRGVTDEEALAEFLDPQTSSLHSPYLLFDMEKAVRRIEEALENDEEILIYGDYDVDGITSTTLLKETLESLGARVRFYIPDRFNDGYGPNWQVYQRFIAEGTQLIITVDNGVAGADVIEKAQAAGVDVIITDHHTLPKQLPASFALIHPKDPRGEYPFDELAGVGVAFKLACALLDEVPREMLDLAAMGTIADLVPLTGENRVIASLGLQQMQNHARLGLNVLLQEAKADSRTITETTVGFVIAPRLNALGRLKNAQEAVTLLSTSDLSAAQEIAREVEQLNTERKTLVEDAVREALPRGEEQASRPVLVVVGDWPEGILGIVAGRLVSHFHKPVIVLTPKDDLLKGSARSVPGVDLYELLSHTSGLLERFGGHAMAAGLALLQTKLGDWKEKLLRTFHELNLSIPEKMDLVITDQLPGSAVDLSTWEALQRLAPFGQGNPQPYFELCGEVTEARQIGAQKNHLKLAILANQTPVTALAFGAGEMAEELRGAARADFAGQLDLNEWNGQRTIQFLVKDLMVPGVQFFDCRKGFETPLPSETTVYILFQPESAAHLAASGAQNIVRCFEEPVIKKAARTAANVVFMDLPDQLSDLKAAFDQLESSRYYLRFATDWDAYLTGVPPQTEFKKAYSLILQQRTLDVRYKLDQIARYLKISAASLKFILDVFQELDFVTIRDGVLEAVPHPAKKALSLSERYQKQPERIAVEKFLVYSEMAEIKKWLLSKEEDTK